MRRSERDLAKAARVTTRRSLLLGGMMTSVVGVLGFRMWQLGVRDAEEYYLLAEENRINLRLVRPDRGRIFDRAGKIVADNEHTYRITLVNEEARDVDDVLAKLQRLLGLTSEDIDRQGHLGRVVNHRLEHPGSSGCPPGDGAVPGLSLRAGLCPSGRLCGTR